MFDRGVAMVIVVMGVSGSGKTTIGRALAAALHWSFSDADDFHSPANVEKMKKGIPLSDEDREPWLRTIRGAIEQWRCDESGHVLACSALKGSYRDILGQNDPDVKFVYLQGAFDVISQRLKERKSHFFNPALLRSQFDALETPEGALIVEVSKEPQEIIRAILGTIQPDKNEEEGRIK
jgi:gluconokinase